MCDGNLSLKEEQRLINDASYWSKRAEQAESWSRHWRQLYFEAMAKLADLEPPSLDGVGGDDA